MATEPTTVRSKPGMPATGRMPSTTVLRRNRYTRQQQHERRTEKRSRHTPLYACRRPHEREIGTCRKTNQDTARDGNDLENSYRFLLFAFGFGLGL